MSDTTQPRKRAVCLTPEARDALSAALVGRWASGANSGKLTRERRADLLGVSIVTAERVLRCEGVDRSTLVLVCHSVGLEWRDSFCEGGAPSPEPLDPESSPGEAPVPVLLPRARREWAGPRLGRWVAVAVLAGFVLIPLRSAPLDPPDEFGVGWTGTFNRILQSVSANYHAGHYTVAERQVQGVILLAREHNAPSQLANALRADGDLALVRGALDEARGRYREALELRDAFKADAFKPALLEALGTVEVSLGDFAAAEKHLRDSYDSYGSLGDPVGVAMAARNLGSLAYLRGDLASAGSRFDEGLRLVKGLDKPDLERDIIARRALVWLKRGRTDEARTQLQACLDYWTRRGHPRWIAVTQFQLAQAEIELGSADNARALLRSCAAGFSKVGDKAKEQEALLLIES